MKLRIRGNTLRLRLTRGEVDAIGTGASVVETTEFPNGATLTYALAVAGEALQATQTTAGNDVSIEVAVPPRLASHWAGSDEVGLDGEEPIKAGPLAILIEKDFTCITPRSGEEELDTFPNPNAATAS